MMLNLMRSTRCIAFHLDNLSGVSKSHLLHNINSKVVPKQRTLWKNYATAAETASRKQIQIINESFRLPIKKREIVIIHDVT